MILLIPLLGNIVIACYDCYIKAKAKSLEQPKQQRIHSSALPPSQGTNASTEISPFPLLDLPKDLLPVVFSSLSPQELGRLASVSKAVGEAANHEDRWEKIVQRRRS